MVALCGAFWNRALVSGAGAEPQCVVRMAEGAREPEFVSWNAFPVGSHKLYAAPGAAIAAREQEGVRVPLEFIQGFSTLAHNYSLRAVPPDYYSGAEGDAFSNAYRRCGQDLAKLRALIATVLDTPAAAIPAAPREVTADVHALAKKSGAAVRWRMGTKENPASPCEFRFTPEQLAIFAAALTQPTTVQQAPSMERFEHVIQWVRDNYQDHSIATLCDGLRAAYCALCRPEAEAPQIDSDAVAKKLYAKHTDNHPTIHCNRFPAWDELSPTERGEWRTKARALKTAPTAVPGDAG